MKTAEAQACEDYPPGFNPSDLIDQKWWELKNNGLDLGWPGGRANLMPSPYGTTGTAGYFPNGTIYNSGYGVYEVHGAIVSVYKSMGGPASWLGFPVSDEYNDPASVHRRSDFEGGYIAYEDGIGGYTAFVTPHILEGGFGCGIAPRLSSPRKGSAWHQSQPFGNYLGVYPEPNGYPYNGYHGGEDWGGNSAGTPVYAVGQGRVAAIFPLGNRGQLVAIEHRGAFVIPAKTKMVNNGATYQYRGEIVRRLYSVYVHVSPKAGLDVNDCVQAGEQIATLASIIGPHLHLEIRMPNQDPSAKWSMVDPETNWQRHDGEVTRYYINLQQMVDAGLRDSPSVLEANQ